MTPKRQVYSGPKGYQTGERGPHSYQQDPLEQQAREDSPATGHKVRPPWGGDDGLPGGDHGGSSKLPEQGCYPSADRSDGKPAADLSGGKPLRDLSDA
jgi:hypothetical protein